MSEDNPNLLGRYYGTRDLRLINSINRELLNDIIQTMVLIFQISPESTPTNIYGETDPENGKVYYEGVILSALIEHPDSTTRQEGFGPEKVREGLRFRFMEVDCREKKIYPQKGDVIYWDYCYFEIDGDPVQDQFVGGQADKSHSIICNAHMTKRSRLNIEPRGQV